MKLIHGGDWAGFEHEYGKRPLDFSASVSPLGLPEGVRQAALEALSEAERYPDPLCRELRAALAQYHGVPAEHIVCGGGAADLIYRLTGTLRPKKAAVFAPCFAEYELALRAGNCEVKRLLLSEEKGFRLEAYMAANLPGDCELLFLCNPNNPTGHLTEREALHRFLGRCRETGAVLVLDECFLELCEDPEAYSLVGELTDHPSLVILKSFTKTYAMAGLRLGYALCGSTALAKRLLSCGQPWAVSGIAQSAGVAALREEDYVNQLRTLISRERRRVSGRLSGLGLRVIPGQANFLLFQSEDPRLAERLRERGVLIRDCRDFAGLTAGWYRVAIRREAENDRLLTALEEALHG